MRVTAFWLTLVATCGLAQELVSTDDNDKINELDNSIHDPFEEYASSDDEEVNGSEYDDQFMKEWEELMVNFNPNMLVTLPIAARSDEFFYEDVTTVGTLMRGAYFVIGSENSESKSGVDLVITDPDGAVVFEKKDQVEGVFSLKAAKKGTYSIMFGNHKWMATKQVTVLMGVGETKALKKDDLNSVTDGILKVDSMLKEIQTEASYMWIKQKSHMKAVSAINSRIYWYYLVEFLILLAVASVQIYYVRGLLSNRRLF